MSDETHPPAETVGSPDGESRTEGVSLYLTPAEKDAVEWEAAAADESLSAYLTRLVRQQRQQDAEAELAETLNPENRLLDVAAEATYRMTESVDCVEQMAEYIREMHACSGTYAAANFELLKRDVADPYRQDALRTGRRRMRTPLDDVLGDGDAVERTGQDSDDGEREQSAKERAFGGGGEET